MHIIRRVWLEGGWPRPSRTRMLSQHFLATCTQTRSEVYLPSSESATIHSCLTATVQFSVLTSPLYKSRENTHTSRKWECAFLLDTEFEKIAFSCPPVTRYAQLEKRWHFCMILHVYRKHVKKDTTQYTGKDARQLSIINILDLPAPRYSYSTD